jgi:4-hydroxybenzoyl-CoA thioesterase
VKYVTELPVLFGDIDHAGVVYYPRFFHYFHQAFERWFGEVLGVPYPGLLNDQDIGFPSVHVETEFTAPLRYGDRVRIELELIDIGRKSITVQYTALRVADGVLSAQARVKTVAVKNSTFESISIPGGWRKRFEVFRSGQTQTDK